MAITADIGGACRGGHRAPSHATNGLGAGIRLLDTPVAEALVRRSEHG